MDELKWKMWKANFEPTEDIDQAYFVYIKNGDIYDDFYDFYADYYEAIRGIHGVGMWVWSVITGAYLNYEDCTQVVNDMNKFEQNIQL